MKEITGQIHNNKIVPFSDEDKEALAEFQENETIRLKITGARKQRSLEQLRLYWVGCRIVAENSIDQHWNTKEKVNFQIKVGLHFFDENRTIVDSKGNVHFYYRSIAYRNLRHLEACRYFDRAFELMALKLNVTVDEFMQSFDDVR